MGLFSAAEIIDMGIEKEKKRRDFYGLVAETFKEKEMKELFQQLRDWEEAHIKKFSQIRKSVEDVEATDSYPGEFQDYIKVLVDEKLYGEASPAQFSRNVKTPLDAIRYGMGFERDAILFFNEFKSYIPTHEAREALQQLIDEEKQHLIYLGKLRVKFQK